MRRECAPSVPISENPGAWLGTYLGTLALQGRDKFTLITSPGIANFGLWVEQLIAESTGKNGKGIIPIVGEPLMAPAHYGNDRLFIYLRLDSDNNTTIDNPMEQIKSSGQPVVTIELQDNYELGAEFFRWEFATAVASAILGVNPFDQPNVQAAKEATKRYLREYTASGRLPSVEVSDSLVDLLSEAGKDKYLAIMAYVRQTPETDKVLTELRQKVAGKYRIATTLGYGPRFLHSTGQLHKGGPNTGLFLQITSDHERDLPIPGEPYTFGVVADAQALGDLQALQSLGRSVVRIHFDQVNEEAVSKIVAEVI